MHMRDRQPPSPFRGGPISFKTYKRGPSANPSTKREMLSVKIVMFFWKITARFGIAADTTLLPKAMHSVAIAAVAVMVLWVVQVRCISKVSSTVDARIVGRAKAHSGDNFGTHHFLVRLQFCGFLGSPSAQRTIYGESCVPAPSNSQAELSRSAFSFAMSCESAVDNRCSSLSIVSSW